MKLAVPDLVSNSYFPALAAIELGCFAQEGLGVSLEVMFPPDRAYAAMRDGGIDLVAASAHTMLAAFPRWRGGKLVCAQAQGMYWFLVMHSDHAVARGDLAALTGRRIGAAPYVEMGLRGLLAQAGLDPVRDGIAIGPVPPHPAAGANFGLSAAMALEARQIDGFWANGMAAERAVRGGFGSIVLDVRRDRGPADGFDLTMATIAAPDRLLRDDPGLAGAVRRAVARAHAMLTQEPELATQVGAALFPPAEAAMIADLIRRDLPFYDTAITADQIRAVNAFARRMGILDADVPFAEVVAA
ncbi:hypothetical protein OPKNFCMD_1391 [Methylobacterium crusticola]|uniref:ABC transporter substrate-binding protein n=1 Tax=Methylobacterium crusticola TaxID=1697972 RepID=A0ABQ4QTL6_9HYPH|nr:ABC transporter substrate-binding protein [Methylobacterium crusticola]GJD48668.1 hypothetical protein OPKNFCMD_1391 [Methylobacterium crusticola]